MEENKPQKIQMLEQAGISFVKTGKDELITPDALFTKRVQEVQRQLEPNQFLSWYQWAANILME